MTYSLSQQQLDAIEEALLQCIFNLRVHCVFLIDMAGNVKEWVDAPYAAYPGSDYQDSHYSPDFRGIRGGGWFDEAEFVLSTNRNGGDPGITANDDIGFRCAK